MQIKIIRPEHYAEHEDLLAQAFALRHKVFAEGRGWEKLRADNGLDIDDHDKDDAIHILACEDNCVMGYTRLVPGGYFLFAQADLTRLSNIASTANIYGLSRVCIAHKDGRRNRTIFASLLKFVLEISKELRINALAFETDEALLFGLRMLGFKLEPLGETIHIAGLVRTPVLLRLNDAVLKAAPDRIAKWYRPSRCS